MGKLADVLREIGTLTVPSRKGEVSFALTDDDLWVTYQVHLPDGTYTDAEIYKFSLSEN